MSAFERNIKGVLKSLLPDIDDSTEDYFESMINDTGCDKVSLKENLAPFLESYGLSVDLESAEAICEQICDALGVLGLKEHTVKEYDEPQLLEKSIQLSKVTKDQISETEQATIDQLWGLDDVRKKRNIVMEVSEAGSAKYERTALKEQRKWLEELECKFVGDDDDANNQISTMTLPDLSGNNREKDIHVSNFNITYGGSILLEGADLRLVFGRRYGLIGRNGIGKTTLLKHMATFDIEGFPK